MENEKRKVGDYTILCAVNIGSREIILAENEQSANGERFLCCYGERNDIFEKFTECAVGDDYIANPFIEGGFRQVKDVVDLRVFDLLNISRINNNRAEEMLLCIYHLLQPDRRIDEGIYNDEIDQYFSYREWKKKHQPLSGVTVREILTTEDLNEGALLRIFDGVTAAFYKSDEYNSREYRYSNLSELRKAMKHKEGGTNGKAQ